MSTEPKLLPPGTGDTPGSDAHGHDTPGTKADAAADFIRQQRDKPKRVYTQTAQPPPPKPEPGPTPPPTGDGPKSEPGSGAPDNTESAREFIEAYNTMQAGGFALLAGDISAFGKFLLPRDIKERAAHHLGKGLGTMGSPEIPWWIGLLLALAIPTVVNYQTAMEHRRAKREGEEPERRPNAPRTARPAQPGGGTPAPAVTVLDRNGAPIRPVTRRSVTPPAVTPCLQCGQPTKRRRKYCSQRCAGLAVSAKRRNASGMPASPAATSPDQP